MARRLFLSPVALTSGGYVPAIESALLSAPRGRRGRTTVVDLRAAEEQGRTRGWMLVIVDDSAASDAAILAAGGVAVPRTRGDISTIIGTEATDETLLGITDDDVIDYSKRVHARRMARFRSSTR